MGSFLVMRAAFDMNSRLQALPCSGLMLAFGCILWKGVNRMMFVSNGFLLFMCGLVVNLCSSNSHSELQILSTFYLFFSRVLFFLCE